LFFRANNQSPAMAWLIQNDRLFKKISWVRLELQCKAPHWLICFLAQQMCVEHNIAYTSEKALNKAVRRWALQNPKVTVLYFFNFPILNSTFKTAICYHV
jgi:hypothetical protein